MAGVATAVAGLLVAVFLASLTVSRLLPVKVDPPASDELTHHLPQDPPSLEANRSLVHQPTTLVEVPNATATGHNVSGLALLQSHEGAEPSAQPARFHPMPLYLLQTLLYALYTALCPLIVLLWWMNVTQAQLREWLRLQGLAAKARLLKLKRAAAFFMELNNFPLLHKAIEIGSFGKKIINEALVVALSQRAGTDSLKAAMERAEKRISALERHLEDSRKDQEEREKSEAGVRREVHEATYEAQALKRDLEAREGGEEERGGNGCTAARMVEREKELAAVQVQLAGVKQELPQLVEAVRREGSEFSEGRLAAARQDLSQQITAEVDEIRMMFQERIAKFAAELKRRERELAAVKQQLGEFRKAAKQEANELKDIGGALQEGSEDAGAMVREEGGRELSKQGCEAVWWNGTAKGGHCEGAGQAIWQGLESASGKPSLNLSGFCSLSAAVLSRISTDPKCFDEEVREGVLVAGSYTAVNDGHGEPFKVNAQVTDPSGQQLHWQHDVAEGHFGFTADETGEFSVCFWLPHEGHHDAKRAHKIDITWTTGKSQKRVSHAAKKERLDHFDLELQNLEDAIDKVTQEMSFFHERELAMRMKTEETHVYVAWLSVASLLVCGTLAALQLWHLKRFFERKKLL
ncbi:unnamed protein product [Closterium sp. Naga37s-1]|nr:unnamed protein product [Closterium sp. Naga37s-1]